jgi:hypothetical protein
VVSQSCGVMGILLLGDKKLTKNKKNGGEIKKSWCFF